MNAIRNLIVMCQQKEGYLFRSEIDRVRAASAELAALNARIEKLEKLLYRIDVAFRTDTTQAEGNDYFWTVRQQLTDALKEAKCHPNT